MSATNENRPVRRHLATAKEHLAGIKAAAAWYQDLMDAHLLDSQTPIKDTPYPASGEEAK